MIIARVPVPDAAAALRSDARIEVLYWPAGVPGQPPDYRVQLVLTDDDNAELTILMTTRDAFDIVHTLTTTLQRGIEGAAP